MQAALTVAEREKKFKKGGCCLLRSKSCLTAAAAEDLLWAGLFWWTCTSWWNCCMLVLKDHFSLVSVFWWGAETLAHRGSTSSTFMWTWLDNNSGLFSSSEESLKSKTQSGVIPLITSPASVQMNHGGIPTLWLSPPRGWEIIVWHFSTKKRERKQNCLI